MQIELSRSHRVHDVHLPQPIRDNAKSSPASMTIQVGVHIQATPATPVGTAPPLPPTATPKAPPLPGGNNGWWIRRDADDSASRPTTPPAMTETPPLPLQDNHGVWRGIMQSKALRNIACLLTCLTWIWCMVANKTYWMWMLAALSS